MAQNLLILEYGMQDRGKADIVLRCQTRALGLMPIHKVLPLFWTDIGRESQYAKQGRFTTAYAWSG